MLHASQCACHIVCVCDMITKKIVSAYVLLGYICLYVYVYCMDLDMYMYVYLDVLIVYEINEKFLMLLPLLNLLFWRHIVSAFYKYLSNKLWCK